MTVTLAAQANAVHSAGNDRNSSFVNISNPVIAAAACRRADAAGQIFGMVDL